MTNSAARNITHEISIRRPAAAVALAFGALALGAAAYAAIAIGRLAIGRITVRHARFGVLEVDELRVRRLRMASDRNDARSH